MFQEAVEHSGRWYQAVVAERGQRVPSNSYVVGEIVKNSHGKNFLEKMANAWIAGVLPMQWERLRDTIYVQYDEAAKNYKLACEKYGAAKVNESKGEWMTWPI
jgi:hypothetical protein